ncbi:MAG: DoxX family membrane protein [Acidobacteria bacterium]|nr:DoxX family membrane protein [Acidobacteriota bacterium]
MAGRVLSWLFRFALAGIFIYAGTVKMYPAIQRDFFMMDLSTYQLLPEWAIVFIAYALPPFEVLLGLLLLSGWKLRYSSAASALLLLGFMGVMFFTYLRGVSANCGCFGDGEPISPWTLTRDSLILIPAIFLIVYSWRLRQASPSPA